MKQISKWEQIFLNSYVISTLSAEKGNNTIDGTIGHDWIATVHVVFACRSNNFLESCGILYLSFCFFFVFFAMKKNSKAVYNAYWFHIIEPPRILFLRIFSGTFFSFSAFSYSVARGVTILFEKADIRTDINMTWIYMSRNSLNGIGYAWKMARGIILAESAVRNCLK